MSSEPKLTAEVIEQIRNNPLPTVLFDLGRAAIQINVHQTPEFKKLISYLMETADGRDRREPWTQRPGVARPVPKLRVAVDACFDMYGDLQWFKLNKTTNKSGQPLLGMFPRMAASIARDLSSASSGLGRNSALMRGKSISAWIWTRSPVLRGRSSGRRT